MAEQKSEKVRPANIKPDKRVIIQADNLLSQKNIRVRPKDWRHQGHPKYANFIIYTNWKHWKSDPTWLYLPEGYEREKNAILTELEDEEKHKRLPYYCRRNRNNQITVNFQNLKRLDFNKQTTVLFFGGKTDENGKWERDAEGKIKSEPSLYFFSNWDYSDNDRLLVEAQAQKDNIWHFTGNYYNSPGYGTITKSFMGHEHANHTRGENWANDPKLKEGTSAFNKIDAGCPACNDCFDYCDDLRVKKAVSGGFKKTMYAQWQPTFKVAYTYLKTSTATTNVTTFNITGMHPETGAREDIVRDVPTNMHLEDWTPGCHNNFWQSGTPALLYLVDKNQKPGAAFCEWDNSTNNYYHELPEIYNNQPHLLNHSAAQFYFQKKLLFTANLRHLATDRKITATSGGKPIFVIHYKVYIRSSIAGILYQFQSGDIYYKWEVEVRGSITNQTMVGNVIKSVVVNAMKNIGGTLLEMGGSIPIFGGLFKAVGKAVKGDGKDKKKGGKLSDILTGDKLEDTTGSKATKGKNEDKKSEQHTERKAKSTLFKGTDKVLATSLFATDTIDFNYDFYEFCNRACSCPFEIRFEHSEVLFNNLVNNNNLATAPIKSISTPFSAFKQLLTPGFIQGDIDLDEDTADGFFSELISRGIPFINKKEDFFTPFKYKYRGLSSYTAKTISAVDFGLGEEQVEQIKTKVKEKLENSDFDKSAAIAGYTTYFRIEGELYNEMAVGKFSSHHTGAGNGGGNTRFSDGKNQVCWGCGLDMTRIIEVPIQNGGIIYTFFNQSDTGEKMVVVPEECMLEIDPIIGEIRAIFYTTTNKYTFKSEKMDADRDEQFLLEEYNDDTTEPTNTSAGVELDFDDDEEREEADPDDLDFGDKEQEQEGEEEAEVDTEFDDQEGEEEAEDEEEWELDDDEEDDSDEEEDEESDEEIEDDEEEDEEEEKPESDNEEEDTDQGGG